MRTTSFHSISPQRANTTVSKSRKKVPDKFVSIFETLPKLSNVDPNILFNGARSRIQDEEDFDIIMSRCNSFSLHEAFEPVLIKMFSAETAVLWENLKDSHEYHSELLNKDSGASNPIFAHIIDKKQTMILDNLVDQQLVQVFQTNPKSPQLFFPLVLNNGIVIAIVHITRKPGDPKFNSVDEQRSNFISRKFKIYGSSLFVQPRTLSYAAKLSHYGNLKATVNMIVNSIKDTFGCKLVDFWVFNEKINLISRYEKGSGFVNIYRCSSGIIGVALKNNMEINEECCKYNPGYSSTIDGDGDDPILICTCEFDGKTWACALRGSRQGPIRNYSGEDEKSLKALMPFIARSLAFSAKLSQPPPTTTDHMEEKIITMLDTASFVSSILDLEELIEVIEARLKNVVKCQAVHLLIISSDKNNFLSGNKSFSIKDGISAKTFESKMPFICNSPEDSDRYIKDLDVGRNNNMEIRSFLSYPIKGDNYVTNVRNDYNSDNNETTIVGILNFINKTDGTQFDKKDIELINELALFCSSALHNTILYQKASRVFNQYKKFSEATNSATQHLSAKKAICDVINFVKEILSSLKVILYLSNNQKLYEFFRAENKNIINKEAFEDKTEFVIANDAAKLVDPLIKEDNKNCFFAKSLINLEGINLGVVEFIFPDKSEINTENLNLMDHFCTILIILIEKLKKQRQIKQENNHYLFKQLINKYEKDSYETPQLLKIIIQENIAQGSIFTINFDVRQFDEVGLIKIAFCAFDEFQIKKKFHITNEKLFFFISESSKLSSPLAPKYNFDNNDELQLDSKFLVTHTWLHSIDILHNVVYLLKLTSLNEIFTSLEILALLVSAISYSSANQNKNSNFINDADENSIQNIAFGVLYKNSYFNEMNILSNFVHIISNNSCNIFENIDDIESQALWKMIIKLIKSMNMKQHFKTQNAFDKIIKDASFSIENHKHRKLLLLLILKCAILSPLIRDFESIAKMASYEFLNEFFMHGDIDQVKNLVYDVDKGFKTLNKERSLSAIVHSVFISPFSSLEGIYSSIHEISHVLQENIAKLNLIPITYQENMTSNGNNDGITINANDYQKQLTVDEENNKDIDNKVGQIKNQSDKGIKQENIGEKSSEAFKVAENYKQETRGIYNQSKEEFKDNNDEEKTIKNEVQENHEEQYQDIYENEIKELHGEENNQEKTVEENHEAQNQDNQEKEIKSNQKRDDHQDEKLQITHEAQNQNRTEEIIQETHELQNQSGQEESIKANIEEEDAQEEKMQETSELRKQSNPEEKIQEKYEEQTQNNKEGEGKYEEEYKQEEKVQETHESENQNSQEVEVKENPNSENQDSQEEEMREMYEEEEDIISSRDESFIAEDELASDEGWESEIDND